MEPLEIDPPVLPALPPEGDPSWLATRTQRAELAGLYFQAQRDEERATRIANALHQRVCAEWARRQP